MKNKPSIDTKPVLVTNRFPDNFKCILWNDYMYFTDYFMGYYDLNTVRLAYLHATKDEVHQHNAHKFTAGFNSEPSGRLIDVVRKHFELNLSYRNHDFSKDKYVEMPFKELPSEVQTVFRKTVFGNGQIAITHNGGLLSSGGDKIKTNF